MRQTIAGCALIAYSLGGPAAQAGETPKSTFQKPVRIVVPFAPGGGQDTTARVLGARLTEIIGQPVLVENRPGGAGIIASEAVLKAPADGHTVYLASTSFVVTPSLRKSLPFDPIRDFAPITRVSSAPGTLVVHMSLPVRSVRDLVQLAKSKPGQVTFGSAGVASNSHLSGELFKVLAGVDIVHVPYKGSAPATTALLGGEVIMTFSNAASTVPQAKAGKLRLLAVTTPKRSPFLPDVPTVAESGVPGFENTIWGGVVVHSATPKATLTVLHDVFTRTLQSPDVKERIAQEGAEVFANDTPAAYAAFIKAEIDKWGRVVRQARIPVE